MTLHSTTRTCLCVELWRSQNANSLKSSQASLKFVIGQEVQFYKIIQIRKQGGLEGQT